MEIKPLKPRFDETQTFNALKDEKLKTKPGVIRRITAEEVEAARRAITGGTGKTTEVAPIKVQPLTSPEEVADFLKNLYENTDEREEQVQLLETFSIMDLELLDLLLRGLEIKQTEAWSVRSQQIDPTKQWDAAIHGKLLSEGRDIFDQRKTIEPRLGFNLASASSEQLNHLKEELLGDIGQLRRETYPDIRKVREVEKMIETVNKALGRKR